MADKTLKDKTNTFRYPELDSKTTEINGSQKNNIGMVDRNPQILSEKKDIENLENSRSLNASSEEIINQGPTIVGCVYSIDCSSKQCKLSYIGESKEKMNKVEKRWDGD
nr:hypothetical protein BgiMline_019700 [Biomphalaria glabrata]